MNISALLQADMNRNVSRAQKELLHWHCRLGHASMKRIQNLLRLSTPEGERYMKTKESKAASCEIPQCLACELGKAKRTNDHLPPRASDDEMHLWRDNLHPGDCVSVDHFICHNKGRLPTTARKEKAAEKFSRALIVVDHASSYINVAHQIQLRGPETLKFKHTFEAFANDFGLSIKKYRSDKGTFAKRLWSEDCEIKKQKQDFARIGAHHQNGVAERAIQTITGWARTMIIHTALHWPE